MPDYGELTTRASDVTAEVNSFYNMDLLERAIPLFVHTRFGMAKPLPKKAGTDTMKWRKYGSLTANTTPLTEGVTGAGKKLSQTEVTAQVQYYGDYVIITDKCDVESKDPVILEANEILGEQAGDSIDQIARDVLVAGTTVQYASTATQRTEVSSAMTLTRAEVKEAVRTLRSNNAKPMTNIVNPANLFNTKAIPASFVGIISEDTLHDLEDETGWVPVEDYPRKDDVMEGEVGSIANVRFVMTTNAKVFSAGGLSSADVHATLIFGKRAYGLVHIDGMSLENIRKPFGHGEDPLNQRATSGWKATFVAKIVQQSFMIRIEHGVSS